MKILAIIFDLNGTLLDDELVYGKAFNKVLKSLGIESHAEYPHKTGIGVKANWKLFIEKYKIKTKKSLEELTRETQDAYLDNINDLEIRGGVTDFLQDLRESGIKVALATSNSWEVADAVLNQIGLFGEFDVVTTSDEVIFNKPDPDIFLTTADKLDIERTECLVIEDSEAGIMAAHRAGMKVIAIARDEAHAEELSGADLVVENFSEITPEVLLDIANKSSVE
jgi:HAD superfamily hydrolase (TIGR01509 family)